MIKRFSSLKDSITNGISLAREVMPTPKTIVSLLSSPKTVAVIKIGVAIVTLCQAIDLYNDTKRKIGFKK